MSNKEFRAELLKIMPGYEWTVHKSIASTFSEATGIQCSGFNRLSTLSVTKVHRDGKTSYKVKSAGYGRRANWLHECNGGTLASALRILQDHYKAVAATYRNHADALEKGRQQEGGAA